MPIPDYQTIMLPLLKYCCDGEEKVFRQSVSDMADVFQLSEAEQKELLPSGKQYIFVNRVGWARTYLAKAGLLEITSRAHFRITDRGKKALSKNLAEITNSYLKQFDEFMIFTSAKKDVPSLLNCIQI